MAFLLQRSFVLILLARVLLFIDVFQEFCEFRAKCGLLWCYDWVSIPMVYTQVVTLATYLFFIFTVIGRQKLEGNKVCSLATLLNQPSFGRKIDRSKCGLVIMPWKQGTTGGYMRSGRMPLDIDLYIPIFTILQFFFYMGLLKVTTGFVVASKSVSQWDPKVVGCKKSLCDVWCDLFYWSFCVHFQESNPLNCIFCLRLWSHVFFSNPNSAYLWNFKSISH